MRKIVVGNWKQNKTLAEVEAWASEFVNLVTATPVPNVDIIVAASYPYLAKLTEFCAAIPNFYVTAQDVSQFEDGRHTGKVSATQIKDFVKYCIVGHSETGDSREVTMKKVGLCTAVGITPILCFVGDIPSTEGSVLVWEDPENISTESGYRPKSSDDISKAVTTLRASIPAETPLLYGGSVNRQNASELSNIPGLTGVLPGNASLDAQHFFEIVSAFN